MNKYVPVRKKAVSLRKAGYSLNEIVDMLNVPKTTAYYWIKNTEIERPEAFAIRTRKHRANAANRAARAVKCKYEEIHQQHADQARRQWLEELRLHPRFGLFLMLYMTEGSKKDQTVRVTNTNPDLIKFAYEWLMFLNFRKKNVFLEVYVYPNHDRDNVEQFWRLLLGVNDIRIYSGSTKRGQLNRRNSVSPYGTARICIIDTYLKTRIDTWIDLLTESVLRVQQTH